MEIRFARADDIGEIAALWCESFPGRRTVADRVRMLETGGPYGGLDTVLVARDRNGRLAGACKIYRMTQHLAGAPLPMMGLAAVAVAPAARRHGLGAALCGAALREARERGDLLSTLYPFRPDYYARLGWGLTGRLLRYRFRTRDLPAYDEARHVRPARFPADADAIAACYSRVAARSSGPIARDERIWAYRLAGQDLGVRPIDVGAVLAGRGGGGNRVIVCDRSGVSGYAILRTRSPTAAGEPMVHIRELIAAEEEAYRALLGYLAAEKARWPLGVHTARPDERFEDRLKDPRPPRPVASSSLYFPTARVMRGPMLRVVNVGAALAARPLGGAPGAVFDVVVRDPQLPANAGTWRVVAGEASAEGRHNSVERVGGPGIPGDVTIEVDPPALARILAGEVSPGMAARLGEARITGDAVRLDAAFHLTGSFWLLDEF